MARIDQKIQTQRAEAQHSRRGQGGFVAEGCCIRALMDAAPEGTAKRGSIPSAPKKGGGNTKSAPKKGGGNTKSTPKKGSVAPKGTCARAQEGVKSKTVEGNQPDTAAPLRAQGPQTRPKEQYPPAPPRRPRNQQRRGHEHSEFARRLPADGANPSARVHTARHRHGDHYGVGLPPAPAQGLVWLERRRPCGGVSCLAGHKGRSDGRLLGRRARTTSSRFMRESCSFSLDWSILALAHEEPADDRAGSSSERCS